MKTWATSILVGVAGIAASTLNATIPRAETVVEHRRINFDAYCKRKFGPTFKAKLKGTTVSDWSCWQSSNNQRHIQVGEACKQQHGTSSHAFDNRNNPYSWYCAVKVNKGRINFDAYCKRKFGPTFKAKLKGTTVSDWSCWQSPNNQRHIQVGEACKQQHGTSRHAFDNRNNPYSWYCKI